MNVDQEIIKKDQFPDEQTNQNDDGLLNIPDIVGTSLFKSIELLKNAGFVPGLILYKDADVESNIVIKQSIAPGERKAAGTKINLVASGKNPINFLPSIYQRNDIKNDDFLRRYLWIFQTVLNSINIKLDNLYKYFDPMEAPSGFFKWLASWFSLNYSFEIEESKLRRLVKEAVVLYQWRGTALGLSRFLEIITGVRPDIIENFAPYSQYTIDENKLVERPIIEENQSPYFFTVSFPVSANTFSIDTLKMINEVIKSEKPANSSYYLVFARKNDENDIRNKFAIGIDKVI